MITDSDGRVTEDAQQKRWKEKRGLLVRLEEGEKVDKEVGSWLQNGVMLRVNINLVTKSEDKWRKVIKLKEVYKSLFVLFLGV